MRTKFKTPRRFVLEQLEPRTVLSTFTVAPTGSDTAAGTAAAPWRTLQHAADVVNAGDTVSVRAGSYAGFVIGWDVPKSGTAAAPITFKADPGVTINASNAKTGDGVDLEGASYVVVDGFNVVGMPRAGIRAVQDNHVTIQNNVTDQNAYWGIFTGHSDDALIQGNTASRSVKQHGIYVSNSGDRPVIRNNAVWGNYGCGIHMNGDVSQGGDGIISGALVSGNTVYDNGRGGGSAINAGGVQSSRFENNLIYNNHGSGISLFRTDGGGPSSGNVVVNNTVLVAADGRWALNLANGSTGTTAYNNVLYNYGSYRGSISASADSLPGLTSDYNVVMDRFSRDQGATRIGLSSWRSATGQDRHSVVATPAQMFVSPTTNDYHLVALSPATGAGTTLTAPAVDKDGRPRPSGTRVDIGCYQYVAPAP